MALAKLTPEHRIFLAWPQGAVISALLANIYVPYVYDLWGGDGDGAHAVRSWML
jgi:hypothetical protein